MNNSDLINSVKTKGKTKGKPSTNDSTKNWQIEDFPSKWLKEERKVIRDEKINWLINNLYTIRALSGLTLSKIDDNTGVSIHTLSLIENGKIKRMPLYQYIVIRKYIESYLTDPFRYTPIQTCDYSNTIELFYNAILSIAISIICNDTKMWSTEEQDFVSMNWDLIKETPSDFSARKSYNYILDTIIKDLNLYPLNYETPEIIQRKFSDYYTYITKDGPNNFSSRSIEYLNNQLSMAPITKIVYFIIAEICIISALKYSSSFPEETHIMLSQNTESLRERITEFNPEKQKYAESYAEISQYVNDDGSIDFNSIPIEKRKKLIKKIKSIISNVKSIDSELENNYSEFRKFLIPLQLGTIDILNAINWYYSITDIGIDDISQKEPSSFILFDKEEKNS